MEGDNAARTEEERLLAEIDRELLGRELVCHPAPEPTDIVWENRHVTYLQRKKRQIGSCIIMVVIMIILFYLLVVLKASQAKNLLKYPATINCDVV